MRITKQPMIVVDAHKLCWAHCFKCKATFEFEVREAFEIIQQNGFLSYAVDCPCCNYRLTSGRQKFFQLRWLRAVWEFVANNIVRAYNRARDFCYWRWVAFKNFF